MLGTLWRFDQELSVKQVIRLYPSRSEVRVRSPDAPSSRSKKSYQIVLFVYIFAHIVHLKESRSSAEACFGNKDGIDGFGLRRHGITRRFTKPLVHLPGGAVSLLTDKPAVSMIKYASKQGVVSKT